MGGRMQEEFEREEEGGGEGGACCTGMQGRPASRQAIHDYSATPTAHSPWPKSSRPTHAPPAGWRRRAAARARGAGRQPPVGRVKGEGRGGEGRRGDSVLEGSSGEEARLDTGQCGGGCTAGGGSASTAGAAGAARLVQERRQLLVVRGRLAKLVAVPAARAAVTGGGTVRAGPGAGPQGSEPSGSEPAPLACSLQQPEQAAKSLLGRAAPPRPRTRWPA